MKPSARPPLVLWAPGTAFAFSIFGLWVVHLAGLRDPAQLSGITRGFLVAWPASFWCGLAGAIAAGVWPSLPAESPARRAILALDLLLLAATFALMVWGIVAGFLLTQVMPGDL